MPLDSPQGRCLWLLCSDLRCSAARVQGEQQKSRLVRAECDQWQRQLQDQQGLLARLEDQKATWYERLAMILHVDLGDMLLLGLLL